MQQISIGKTGGTVNVNYEAFPANVQEYVIRYGLTQILNDCHSQETKKAGTTPEAVMALVEKKLAAMLAGTIRASFTRTGNPVKAEAIRLATNVVKVAARAKGKKLDPKAIRELAESHLAKHPELIAQAKATVAANVEAAGDVDLD